MLKLAIAIHFRQFSPLEFLKDRLNHLVHVLIDLFEVGIQDALTGIHG